MLSPFSVGRTLTTTVSWNTPWVQGLSVDLAYEGTSERISSDANTLVILARYALALGGRYRFELFAKMAAFRAQLASVNNVYGFNSAGEGLPAASR